MTEHKPVAPPSNGRCTRGALVTHPHMEGCWQAGWQAGYAEGSVDAEGADEWCVEYLRDDEHGAEWKPFTKEGFSSYEQAAAFAAIAPEGRVLHRHVTPWRAVEPEPVVPEVQEGSL